MDMIKSVKPRIDKNISKRQLEESEKLGYFLMLIVAAVQIPGHDRQL